MSRDDARLARIVGLTFFGFGFLFIALSAMSMP